MHIGSDQHRCTYYKCCWERQSKGRGQIHTERPQPLHDSWRRSPTIAARSMEKPHLLHPWSADAATTWRLNQRHKLQYNCRRLAGWTTDQDNALNFNFSPCLNINTGSNRPVLLRRHQYAARNRSIRDGSSSSHSRGHWSQTHRICLAQSPIFRPSGSDRRLHMDAQHEKEDGQCHSPT